MKSLIILTTLLTVLSSIFPAPAQAGSNYPLYNLNNVMSYEISQNATTLFTFEQSEDGTKFVSRNITTGDPTLTVPLNIPAADFMNTVIVEDNIYIFQIIVLNREKRLIESSLFQLNTHTGQSKNIYKSEENKGFAEKFYATKNGLLLTEKRGNSPYLFNLKSNQMTAIDLAEDLRIRSFDLEKNSAVIIKQSNFSTNVKSNDDITTYTEGGGDLLEAYVCDFSNDYKLTNVGQYQPNYVISKNEEETFLPHFIINNESHSWVEPSFMINRFPLNPGGLIGDPTLQKTMESLNNYEMINEVTFVNDQYVIARQFSDMGEISLVVFDIKNPTLSKAETVSKDDQKKIKALFRDKATTEKTILDPAIISQVFDASFYKIDLVTTTVDSTDGMVSTMSSTESFMAVASGENYSVLKQNEELLSSISEDFILNEKSATQFQDCLDLLFPLGHFDKKHKAFYNEADRWVFIRGESFGDKSGIVVHVDDHGKILGISPDEKTPGDN